MVYIAIEGNAEMTAITIRCWNVAVHVLATYVYIYIYIYELTVVYIAMEGNAEMTAITIRCWNVVAMEYMPKVIERMLAPSVMTLS